MIIKGWIGPMPLLFVGVLKRNFVINGLAAFLVKMKLGLSLLSPSLRLIWLGKITMAMGIPIFRLLVLTP